MAAPSSDLIHVQDIAGAGRGVLARASIPAGTSILKSAGPAAHVIFRQYRKEVCAQCFHYDRGRTLSVRDNSTGKVFCSEACHSEWLKAGGELGLEAWQALETFVKTRSKAIANTALIPANGSRPGSEAIASTYEESGEIAMLQRQARVGMNSGPGIKAEREYRKALHHVWTQPIDPDILGYLLAGILFHSQQREQYERDVLALAMDEEPYRSNADLEAHCNAFLQLTAILPPELLPSCTITICQTLVNAGSHNSFGIRSGSDEDMEEYMGYSLHPAASYFNHSCEPNVGKKREGRAWMFTTAREAGLAEELCISYLGGDENGMTVTERRARLQEVWGFECGCGRCNREAASSNGSAEEGTDTTSHLMP